jgi:hypothetical protein
MFVIYNKQVIITRVKDELIAFDNNYATRQLYLMNGLYGSWLLDPEYNTLRLIKAIILSIAPRIVCK